MRERDTETERKVERKTAKGEKFTQIRRERVAEWQKRTGRASREIKERRRGLKRAAEAERGGR